MRGIVTGQSRRNGLPLAVLDQFLLSARPHMGHKPSLSRHGLEDWQTGRSCQTFWRDWTRSGRKSRQMTPQQKNADRSCAGDRQRPNFPRTYGQFTLNCPIHAYARPNSDWSIWPNRCLIRVNNSMLNSPSEVSAWSGVGLEVSTLQRVCRDRFKWEKGHKRGTGTDPFDRLN